MYRAQLMGDHTHTTLAGVRVHIWRRGDTYLARGRYAGRAFGETLGSDVVGATVRLRQLLTEIEMGSYVRPSEGRTRSIKRRTVVRLTLRELVGDFVSEKRKAKGRNTAETYRSRLSPVLDFSELPRSLKRWPFALDIDREFIVDLRAFLFGQTTTRNGRVGGTPKSVSARQIINILECLRAALSWARQADVGKLPANWANPLTPELIGKPATKDPLREDMLPLDVRIRLVGLMDGWQLCHLALLTVLPLRPEEAAGLLISEVDFTKGWFSIGTRAEGDDFTKGFTSFKLPFPDEMRPILTACMGSRIEGPLLRSRRALEQPDAVPCIADSDALMLLYAQELRASRHAIQAEQDRKAAFRRVLRTLGGVSTDRLAVEFKTLLSEAKITNGASLYTLRSSVTTAMHRANIPHLEMRYLTGHTTKDIMNAYTTLDPVGAMLRYFSTIRPLLDAIRERAAALGFRG